jgi:hypothetical protein
MNQHPCPAESCNKSYHKSKELARHIRNAKAKEAAMEEHLRPHSALVVRPRGRIPRQEQVADENMPEPVVDVVELQVNEQEPAQGIHIAALPDMQVPFQVSYL